VLRLVLFPHDSHSFLLWSSPFFIFSVQWPLSIFAALPFFALPFFSRVGIPVCPTKLLLIALPTPPQSPRVAPPLKSFFEVTCRTQIVQASLNCIPFIRPSPPNVPFVLRMEGSPCTKTLSTGDWSTGISVGSLSPYPFRHLDFSFPAPGRRRTGSFSLLWNLSRRNFFLPDAHLWFAHEGLPIALPENVCLSFPLTSLFPLAYRHQSGR